MIDKRMRILWFLNDMALHQHLHPFLFVSLTGSGFRAGFAPVVDWLIGWLVGWLVGLHTAMEC